MGQKAIQSRPLWVQYLGMAVLRGSRSLANVLVEPGMIITPLGRYGAPVLPGPDV